MCILFLIANGSIGEHYKLILVANRDEYYRRPARIAEPWDDDVNVYGGRDMEPGREGGSWLALGHHNNIIKIGALLNIRGGHPSNASTYLGRGPIVANYVKSSMANTEYCDAILHHDYNAFNFVSVEIDTSTIDYVQIMHASNSPNGVHLMNNSKSLGFGNSPIESPLVKVKAGTKMFDDIISDRRNLMDKELLIKELLNLLKCRKSYFPDVELENRTHEDAKGLSSICVRMPDFGSRTRTIILIDRQNCLDYYEETMATDDSEGEWIKTHLKRQL